MVGLFLVLGLMACADKGSEDTGGDSDSALPEGDTTICGSLLGFQSKGQTWTYSWVSGERVGTAVTSLDDLDALGGTAMTTSVYTATSEDLAYTLTMTSNYVCDGEGLWTGTLSTSWETVSGEYTSSDWRLSTYNPPWLTLQRDATSGSTWTGSTTVESQGGSAEPEAHDETWSMSATAETITVPAGTYEALRVDVGADLGVTSWYAEGVGLVATGDLQLVSMTP